MMIQYSFPNTATMYPREDCIMLQKNPIRLSITETLLTVMQFIHESLKKSPCMHKLQPYNINTNRHTDNFMTSEVEIQPCGTTTHFSKKFKTLQNSPC